MDDEDSTAPDDQARFARGSRLRAQVLGQGHLERNGARSFEESDDLQRLVTELGWGTIWRRGVLDLKARSLVTVAMLIALDRPHELTVHVRGALNNGATAAEIKEVALHSILYCGFPAAIEATAVIAAAISVREDPPV